MRLVSVPLSQAVALAFGGCFLVLSLAGLGQPDPAHAVTARSGGPVTVGQAPEGLAAADGSIYVTNSDDDTVSVIDESSSIVVATIPVGDRPVAAVADGDQVYVANEDSGTISIIDEADNLVVATIPAGRGPLGITSSGGFLYVTSSDYNSLTVISEETRAITRIMAMPNGSAPAHAVVSNGKLYVADLAIGTVSVYDPSTGKKLRPPITVEGAPWDIIADRGTLYVTNRVGNSVSSIDEASGTVIATTPIEYDPVGLVAYDGAVYVAVTGLGAPRIAVIDEVSHRVYDTFGDGLQPWNLVADQGRLYVTDSGNLWSGDSHSVSVFDLLRTQRILFTSSPSTPARVGGHYRPTATGGRSTMPVTFAVDDGSNGACAIDAEGRVWFLGVGTCNVVAHQSGDDQYGDAPPVIQSTLVRRIPDEIYFRRPDGLLVGHSNRLTASARSGRHVVLSSLTPGKCRVAGTIVTGRRSGNCRITAVAAQSAAYSGAHKTRTFHVRQTN